MLEVACSAGSRRTTSRHTARRCCPRIGAPSTTSSTAAPRRSAARSGTARRATPRCSPTIPAAIAAAPSATPHRPRSGSNVVRRSCCRCRHFHITITAPAELRAVLRANQRDGYGALMQACAAAIIELARDPRYVGGTVAVLAVLHTWTQQLRFASACSLPGQLAAGSPRMPAPGTRRAGTSWSPSRLSPNWCAASSARCCAGSVPISSSPTRCGAHDGSSTSPPGATVNRRCSTTSPVMSFASLSPMPGSSVSTMKPLRSNTRNARPGAHEPAV